ncbi:MAG: pirin family protein, partial [Pedobacter sp.]
MKTQNQHLHLADSRGVADHGWLKSRHTFSFAGYYEEDRMQFGAIRVLNDDEVSGGQGFGLHPHNNMEIISIPLEGELVHKDSMGNETTIKTGEIQVMSAGTGVKHSEYNKNADAQVKFLQIWVLPNKRNVTPRYDQRTFSAENMHNNLLQILSPNASDNNVWIHQDAWFSIAKFDQGHSVAYNVKKEGNGVYILVLEGSIEVNGQLLNRRDGLGITGEEVMSINAVSNTQFLLMDV